MSETRYRLADSVVLEPLVNDYHAWWCVLAPLPAAMHAAGYQVPALRSFLRNPATHLRAARSPELAGGPFLALEESAKPDVERLLARTEARFADGAALYADLWSFMKVMLAEATGETMEPFYPRLPASLAGLVELTYDYFNRPTMRFDEGLLYASSHYKPDLQSMRLWSLRADADRPFYMSTPHFHGEGEIEWRVPFDDPAIDVIARLDVTPAPRADIVRALGPALGIEALDAMLVPGEPLVDPAFRGEGVRIRYVGHACVLLEGGGKSVLVDPFVSPRPSEGGVPRFSFADLPARIDYAMITHAHPDHLCLETLLRLRTRIGTLVVPRAHAVAFGDISLKRLAQRLGFKNVVELDTMDVIDFGGGAITGLPFLGEHGDILHGSKVTFLVELGGKRVLFAADSACLDIHGANRVRDAVGPIETVFMNMEIDGAPISWPFDALFPKERDKKKERTRKCRGSTPEEGLALLGALGAKRMFNYAMGYEPWLALIIGPSSAPDSPRMIAADKLLVSARQRGVEALRLEGSQDIILDD